MPVREEVEQAIAALDRVRSRLKDPQTPEAADPEVGAQLTKLSVLLEDPMFARMLTIQESLCRLRSQLVAHPSLVPADFDITPDSGELVVRLTPLAGRQTARLPASPRHARPARPDEAGPAAGQQAEMARDDQIAAEQEQPPQERLHQQEQPQEQAPAHSLDDSVELDDIDLEMSAQTPIMTGTYERELERAIAEVARGRQVVHIELCKEDGASLGFSVAGLASEHNQELGIFVQGIQPDGTADRDGRLQEGDQILAIDGQPLDANVSHPQAISILQQARGLVNLVVARSPEPAAEAGLSSELLTSLHTETPQQQQPQPQQDMVLNTEWAQVEVIDLVNDGTGLGFGIIGGRSTGVVVKTILPGGVADRDGRLHSGDHILQIGQHNLRGMESVQVAQVLRTAGTQVRLIVARPVETSSPEFQVAVSENSLITRAPILPTRLLADPDELDHQLQLLQNGFPEPYTHDMAAAERNGLLNGLLVSEYDGVTPLNQLGHVPASPPSPLHLLPDTETTEVELVKDAAGLGVTIAGYVCEREELSGIFIKSVNPGSAADLSGRIAINDQIIEVDGTPLQGYTNHEAVELLKNTGRLVRLKLARYVSGPKYDQLRQAIARTEMASPAAAAAAAAGPPEPPARPSLHDRQASWSPPTEGAPVAAAAARGADSPEDSRWDTGSLQWIDSEQVSAYGAAVEPDEYRGPVAPEVEEAVQRQWTDLLGDGYDIVVAQLSKFQPGGGLGVSLEGTVDVEDGREVRPRHYIRSILADGPVGLNGRLLSGDELLEVNGRPLLNLNHMEVVSVLKELPMHVRLVCARAWQPPSQPEPDRVGGVPEPSYPCDRLLKAKSDSSLASSGASVTDTSQSRLRSRSMEPLSGLAMWAAEPLVVTLEKGERGLGFSILDYQDPMNPKETVIVIRSLVPGGAAQLDGRLIPGDRLMSVNAVHLENASLDEAVQALKGAPAGPVRLGVAKPLPLAADTSSNQGFTSTSQSEVDVDEVGSDISTSSAGSQRRHLADVQGEVSRRLSRHERLLFLSNSSLVSPRSPVLSHASPGVGRRLRHGGAAQRPPDELHEISWVPAKDHPAERQNSRSETSDINSTETLKILCLPGVRNRVSDRPEGSYKGKEGDKTRALPQVSEARSYVTSQSQSNVSKVTPEPSSGVEHVQDDAYGPRLPPESACPGKQHRPPTTRSPSRTSSSSSYSSSYSPSVASVSCSADSASLDSAPTEERDRARGSSTPSSVATSRDSNSHLNYIESAAGGSRSPGDDGDGEREYSPLMVSCDTVGENMVKSDQLLKMVPRASGTDLETIRDQAIIK